MKFGNFLVKSVHFLPTFAILKSGQNPEKVGRECKNGHFCQFFGENLACDLEK